MQKTEEEKYRFKVVMLGDPNTGKTSLVQRYVYDQFEEQGTQSTIGVDVLKKNLTLDNELVKLNLWDTGGQDKYSSITDQYFRKTLGFVLVYDITDENTFDSLDYWMEKIRDKAIDNVIVYLAGNKIDLAEKRVIQNEDAEKYQEKNKIDRVYLVSAKEGDNVNNMYQDLAQEIIEKIKKNQLPNDAPTANTQDIPPAYGDQTISQEILEKQLLKKESVERNSQLFQLDSNDQNQEKNQFAKNQMKMFLQSQTSQNQQKISDELIGQVLEHRVPKYYQKENEDADIQAVKEEFKTFPRLINKNELEERSVVFEEFQKMIQWKLNENCIKHYNKFTNGYILIQEVNLGVRNVIEKIQSNRQQLKKLKEFQKSSKNNIIKNKKKETNIAKVLNILIKIRQNFGTTVQKIKQIDNQDQEIEAHEIILDFQKARNFLLQENQENKLSLNKINSFNNMNKYLDQKLIELENNAKISIINILQDFSEKKLFSSAKSIFYIEKNKNKSFLQQDFNSQKIQKNQNRDYIIDSDIIDKITNEAIKQTLQQFNQKSEQHQINIYDLFDFLRDINQLLPEF